MRWRGERLSRMGWVGRGDSLSSRRQPEGACCREGRAVGGGLSGEGSLGLFLFEGKDHLHVCTLVLDTQERGNSVAVGGQFWSSDPASRKGSIWLASGAYSLHLE